MPLKDAEKFIREIAQNNEFRNSLYSFNSSREIQENIRAKGYSFELFEFEESVNYLKTESPNEEQAIMLDELLLWWNMLIYDGTAEDSRGTACNPAQCSSCSSCS